jgi:hypothetical protein
MSVKFGPDRSRSLRPPTLAALVLTTKYINKHPFFSNFLPPAIPYIDICTKMVIKSPYPYIDVPEVDIPTLLFETERPKQFNYPRNRPLFIDAKTGTSLSLDQLHDQCRRFGQGLKEQWNWKKDDVLCIFSLNQLETPVIIWGTHYALGVGITPLLSGS